MQILDKWKLCFNLPSQALDTTKTMIANNKVKLGNPKVISFYEFIMEKQQRLINNVPDLVKQCYVNSEVAIPECGHSGCCLQKTAIHAHQYCEDTANQLLQEYC